MPSGRSSRPRSGGGVPPYPRTLRVNQVLDLAGEFVDLLLRGVILGARRRQENAQDENPD